MGIMILGRIVLVWAFVGVVGCSFGCMGVGFFERGWADVGGAGIFRGCRT